MEATSTKTSATRSSALLYNGIVTARLTWDMEHKLLMVGNKHGSDDGKLLIAIMGNVMLSLKIFS